MNRRTTLPSQIQPAVQAVSARVTTAIAALDALADDADRLALTAGTPRDIGQTLDGIYIRAETSRRHLDQLRRQLLTLAATDQKDAA